MSKPRETSAKDRNAPTAGDSDGTGHARKSAPASATHNGVHLEPQNMANVSGPRKNQRLGVNGFAQIPQPFWRFAVETCCFLGFFLVIWQLCKLVPLPLISRVVVSAVKGNKENDVLLLSGTAFALLSALVYYGTSFVITPASVLRALLPRRVADQVGKRSSTPSEVGSLEDSPGDGYSHTSHQDVPASILELSANSASLLVHRMERRTNTHLILGMTVGIIGLLVWYVLLGRQDFSGDLAYPIASVPGQDQLYEDKPQRDTAEQPSPQVRRQLSSIEESLSGLQTSIEELRNAQLGAAAKTEHNQLSWPSLLQSLLPRITVLLFIEILAGFFLRQYRIAVEDLKYFLELERLARARRLSYAIIRRHDNRDEEINFAKDVLNETSFIRLKTGETNTVLETLKTEKNIALEALATLGDQLKRVLPAKEVDKKD